jgi:tetrapyrrole methylase family protein/MazG family protein
MKKLEAEFKRSVEIMDKLRGPGGCPWDREQTVTTLRKYIIEEAYELVEALDLGRTGHVVEELGDLLFQVLFQARIGKEGKRFDLYDVLKGLNNKMTRRHPHVFGALKGKVHDPKVVLERWSEIKKKEGKKSVLDGVPKKMPSLLRAYRLTEKASSVGFDWRDPDEILKKLQEEIQEFRKAGRKKRKRAEKRADELGDMLFTVVNLCRFLEIDPDHALRKTIEKFESRFHYVEKGLKKAKIDIKKAGLDRMERLWEEAKGKVA